MEALFLLIPLSLLGVAAAIWFFLRMNESGQFDDADGPAWRMLMDDDNVLRREADAGPVVAGPKAQATGPGDEGKTAQRAPAASSSSDGGPP